MIKIPRVINEELKLDSQEWKHLTKTKLLNLKKIIKEANTITLVDRFFDNRKYLN